MNNGTTLINANTLRLIEPHIRRAFFWIFVVVSPLALLGNVFAIKSIVLRNIKCLQKVCITNLALADVFTVLVFGTVNIETLSKELKTWSLGEFMCYFLPMAQMIGTTASSFCLLVIAVDRFQNLNCGISGKWNPSPVKCILITIFIWILSAAIASPMFLIFEYEPIMILEPTGLEPTYEPSSVCMAIQKNNLENYYIIITVVIFVPMTVAITYFYCKIAMILWHHRVPGSSATVGGPSNDHTSSSGTNVKPEIKKMKNIKNVQFIRKVRTFKIIIVLMIAFIACRLPYWVFNIVKLVRTVGTNAAWIIHFTFNFFILLNCGLNPLLYTFLNQSISLLGIAHNLLKKLLLCCCFFTNADFDEFTKYNPFEVEYEQKKQTTAMPKDSKNVLIKFVNVATTVSFQNSQK